MSTAVEGRHLSERLNGPVSTEELQRRWAAIRDLMDRHGVAVLVVQSHNDYMGGYAKYLTDLPAENGYPFSVVFPADEPMTLVRHGDINGDRRQSGDSDTLRGVQRVLTTASMVSASYTRYYDAQLIAEALRPYAQSRIGLVPTAAMSFATVELLKRVYPEADLIEASDLVDEVRMLKSAEEIRYLQATALLQDRAMAAAFAAAAPGKRESDIAAVAQHVAMDMGSEQGIFRCASASPGEPSMIAHRHYQNRVLREGDIFYLLIETNGPGGLYTELGRTCVLGTAPARLRDEYLFTLEARRFCHERLRPGIPAAEVWDEYNAFLRANGKSEEKRLHCHGQGVDLVERPLVRFDEPAEIQASMNLACHPRHVSGGFVSWVCDNILVQEDGIVELHAYPTSLVELA
jgi:Xaa-Pro aminopeptidase